MALVMEFLGVLPRLGKDVYLAPNATLIGDIELGDDSSVWFGAVLRGDVGPIRIGARTNIQDLACLHTTEDLSQAILGDDITVGHGAILHGCRIGDGCLIGMGSILLDNVEVGSNSVIAAGSVVPPRMVIPARSMVRGNPARIIGEVTEGQAEFGRIGAARYVENARRFLMLSKPNHDKGVGHAV